MIRATIYSVLVCGIMTIGLVAFAKEPVKPQKPSDHSKSTTEIGGHGEARKNVPLRSNTAEKSKNRSFIQITALIKGTRNAQGQIIAQLYDKPGAFNHNRYNQAVSTIVTPAKGFSGELHFRNLTPGRYALVLFHDENNNQIFDETGSFIEGYAYSNNTGKKSPAAFNQAAFTADTNKKLVIRLIYH